MSLVKRIRDAKEKAVDQQKELTGLEKDKHLISLRIDELREELMDSSNAFDELMSQLEQIIASAEDGAATPLT